MFSYERKGFCQKGKVKPWERSKILSRGKDLTMNQKGFAKKERFCHEKKRFCQEIKV